MHNRDIEPQGYVSVRNYSPNNLSLKLGIKTQFSVIIKNYRLANVQFKLSTALLLSTGSTASRALIELNFNFVFSCL